MERNHFNRTRNFKKFLSLIESDTKAMPRNIGATSNVSSI